jgi:hypothetical protein
MSKFNFPPFFLVTGYASVNRLVLSVCQLSVTDDESVRPVFDALVILRKVSQMYVLLTNY